METVGAAGWPFWNKFQHFLFSLLASEDQVFAETEELPFEANSTDVLLQRFLLICPKPFNAKVVHGSTLLT